MERATSESAGAGAAPAPADGRESTGGPTGIWTAPGPAPAGAPDTPPPPPMRGRTPVSTTWRLIEAHLVTAQVVLSYLSLFVQRRFRSEEATERLTRETHRRNARRIQRAVVRLQGLFIKVGQLFSIMANFLPEAFRDELESLQDHVPPHPYQEIEVRLRHELGGRPPRDVFAEFDERPVASASIGQVHVARLRTGEKVAVKVQYPDIEEIVRIDLVALRRIFWVLRWFMPDYGFDTIYREIREMVLAELDYRQEADAIDAISARFAGRKDVLFPRVIRELSTARVLTAEWMDGTKAADVARLDTAGIDRRKAARLVVEAYCQQIFIDGRYHADPHPGNLLLRPPAPGALHPSIVFLDFGATARVSEAMRRGMVSFLQGAMARDTPRIVAAMKDMGFISRRADPEVFDRVVEYFHDKFRQQIRVDAWSLKDIKFEPEKSLGALLDLRELNVSLSDLRDAFHVPKEWILLERTLLLLLGVCTTLDPDMNPTAIIEPYLQKFLLGDKKEWSDTVVEASREMALSILALPGEMKRFISRAMRGDLEVRFRNLEDGARLVYTAGQQLLWGMLAAASAVLAVVFDGRGQPRALFAAKIAAAVFGGLLALALLAGRRFRRRR